MAKDQPPDIRSYMVIAYLAVAASGAVVGFIMGLFFGEFSRTE